MISLSSSSSFAMSSGTESVEPVMLPPGRARLATTPVATASPMPTMTMGIVVVACLAARAPGVPTTPMPRQESVLALDDPGHYKVGFAGLAKHRHHVTALQQPSDLGADATQQECDLFAVGHPDHHRGPRQRLNAAVDALGPHQRSIRRRRRTFGRVDYLGRELIRTRPFEADQGHRSPSFHRWNT